MLRCHASVSRKEGGGGGSKGDALIDRGCYERWLLTVAGFIKKKRGAAYFHFFPTVMVSLSLLKPCDAPRAAICPDMLRAYTHDASPRVMMYYDKCNLFLFRRYITNLKASDLVHDNIYTN